MLFSPVVSNKTMIKLFDERFIEDLLALSFWTRAGYEIHFIIGAAFIFIPIKWKWKLAGVISVSIAREVYNVWEGSYADITDILSGIIGLLIANLIKKWINKKWPSIKKRWPF